MSTINATATIRPVNYVNKTPVANETISSEYWLNMVIVHDEEIDPETGKPITIVIPGQGRPIDNIVKNCTDAAPKKLTEKSSIITRLKSELPLVGKDLLDVAMSLKPGQRELLFRFAQTDENGELEVTNFGMEVYRVDLEAKELPVDECVKNYVPLRKFNVA